MAVFADLNVEIVKPIRYTKDAITTAVKLGYECVAINNFIPQLKSKGKKQHIVVQPPHEILLDNERWKHLNKNLRQLSRITTIVDDPAKTAGLSSPDVQAYDLVAVEPTSEKTFHLACGTLDIDIISLNLAEKLPFYIKRPSINLALERGIFFEIKYAPAIRDSTARKNVITSAQSLVEVCKGKNVIVSSGCEKALEIRGPYDVINLNLLFGLNPSDAKDSVSVNCRSVLKHAEARKMKKCAIQIMKSSTLSITNFENKRKKRKTEELIVKSEDDQPKEKKRKDT